MLIASFLVLAVAIMVFATVTGLAMGVFNAENKGTSFEGALAVLGLIAVSANLGSAAYIVNSVWE